MPWKFMAGVILMASFSFYVVSVSSASASTKRSLSALVLYPTVIGCWICFLRHWIIVRPQWNAESRRRLHYLFWVFVWLAYVVGGPFTARMMSSPHPSPLAIVCLSSFATTIFLVTGIILAELYGAVVWIAVVASSTVFIEKQKKVKAKDDLGPLDQRGTAQATCNRQDHVRQRHQGQAKFVLAFVAIMTVAAVYEGSLPPQITHVTVKLPNLPRHHDGFSIIHLSDIHLGPVVGVLQMQELVALVNHEFGKAKADVIVITGDLVDATVDQVRESALPLMRLQSKYGKFFVTGNHEYHNYDVDNWYRLLSSVGIQPLHNNGTTVAEAVNILGVPDPTGIPWGHVPNVRRALSSISPKARHLPNILLSHQPKTVVDHANIGIDLQLSGHTHGGQIFPFHFLVHMGNKGFLSGLYQHEDVMMWVSRGTLYWGPPMRLLARREVTRIVLRSTP